METVSSDEARLGNNYVAAPDIAILDPKAIREMAERFYLDADATVEAFAVHEAVHHIHDSLMPNGKYETYRAAQHEINLGGLVTFLRWREVEEFMADAAMVQLGREAVMFATTRVIEDPEAADKPRRRHRKRLHDASARFIYLVIKRLEEQMTDRRTPLGIDWLRLHRRDSEQWNARFWKRWETEFMTDDVVKAIQSAYLHEFRRIQALVMPSS